MTTQIGDLAPAGTAAVPQNLDELAEALRSGRVWPGAPMTYGELDWTELPVFGGSSPPDTSGIWSWDETRLLVGTCADDLEIVTRDRDRD